MRSRRQLQRGREAPRTTRTITRRGREWWCPCAHALLRRRGRRPERVQASSFRDQVNSRLASCYDGYGCWQSRNPSSSGAAAAIDERRDGGRAARRQAAHVPDVDASGARVRPEARRRAGVLRRAADWFVRQRRRLRGTDADRATSGGVAVPRDRAARGTSSAPIAWSSAGATASDSGRRRRLQQRRICSYWGLACAWVKT